MTFNFANKHFEARGSSSKYFEARSSSSKYFPREGLSSIFHCFFQKYLLNFGKTLNSQEFSESIRENFQKWP